MQAIVLVGGEGTRLQPLTLTRPKPALRLVDRPFIAYACDWLARHGVTEAVMACGFRAEDLREALGDETEAGLRVSYLEEPEPLGTAGPIRLALDRGLLGERFLVLNGDLLADLDLTRLQQAHAARGAQATIAVHPVDNPAPYGLVRHDAEGAVTEFVEKPEPDVIDTDEVNAGAYVLERSVAEGIPAGRAVSIEREIFPRLVGNGLYAERLEGYWLDIGVPERFLGAAWDILERRVRTDAGDRLDDDGMLVEDGAEVAGTLIAPALVGSGTVLELGAIAGPRAVLAPGCRLGRDAAVHGSLIGTDSVLGSMARVEGSILGDRVEVGEGARIASGAVIGDGAKIAPGAEVEAGARVDPGGDGRLSGALEAIRGADSEGQLDDVLALPDHLRDALWRFESAKIGELQASGLAVCGMGGSGIGGWLAAAALGDRLSKPLLVVRDYELAPWTPPDHAVLCMSYSGNTEETIACFAAAEALGGQRMVATTGGALADAARAADVPVIGIPSGIQPRAAVGYMFAIAAEAATATGVAVGLRTEIDAAAAALEGERDAIAERAAELAAQLEGTTPVIYGADLTAPVAYRWKTQVNENAKQPAFTHELPEMDHNEIVGWERAPQSGRFSAIFLTDSDQHPRQRQRAELTAELVEPGAERVITIETSGETRTHRLLAAVMLGDLVSLNLAARRGVDPSPVPVIEELKDRLGRP